MSFAEFRSLLFGLLAADTRTARHLRAEREPASTPQTQEGGDEHVG